MGNKFYITTAIAYTSRKPHIGNTYEIILTDATMKKDIKKSYYFLVEGVCSSNLHVSSY